MTELSGTLEGVGLPAIVRFLTGLKKTGCLRIEHNDWRGEIFFELGHVTGASLASRHGLTALDALVQALPGGNFTFDGTVQRPAGGAANISLSSEALQAHLDDLAGSTANGTPRLPSFDEVPAVLDQDESSSGEETVPLDRGTLQTLLAVDGRRTVEEIVAQRGSLDVLWQLANLVEVGLLRINADAPIADPAEPAASAATPVGPIAAEPDRVTPSPAAAAQVEPIAPEPVHVVPIPVAPAYVEPSVDQTVRLERSPADPPRDEPTGGPTVRVEPRAVEPERAPPVIARPFARETVAAVEASAHCPKLGFEDDPSNAFSRPTRMHRCFAAGTPLPLSLDQQRELCLSEEFGTCPRLTMAASAPQAHSAQRTTDVGAMRRAGPGSRRPEPEADDPRIVRLPLLGRANAAERGAVADRQAVGGVGRTRFRAGATPVYEGASAPSTRPMPSTPPTPLRSRLDRGNGPGPESAVTEQAAVSAPELGAINSNSVPEASAIAPMERRWRGIPVVFIAVGSVVLVVLAMVAYLLVPRLGDVFVDETVDPSKMPNTSAVVAGTPIAQLAGPRSTALARATAAAAAIVVAAAPGSSDAAASKPATSVAGAASAASASSAAPAPTLPPEPTKPAAAPAGATQPAASTLFDERFANNDRNWPSTPQGTAFLTNGSYRLAPRRAGQFVAVGAPIADALQDVVVNATFHKLSGPPGGGYGILVRDQAAAPQNGVSQDGRYYVLEVGDNGDVGMWRRDGDHWVDLLPWQPNAAVKPDVASNELSVRAVGNRLSLTVNGTLVATKTDDTFAAGGVGVFVGGDGNQVSVDRFSIHTP